MPSAYAKQIFDLRIHEYSLSVATQESTSAGAAYFRSLHMRLRTIGGCIHRSLSTGVMR